LVSGEVVDVVRRAQKAELLAAEPDEAILIGFSSPSQGGLRFAWSTLQDSAASAQTKEGAGMSADFDRTTAAILTADQAHLTRMNNEVSWWRTGVLARLTRGDLRAVGWRRLFRRRG
jgi:hypothetical protein